MNILAVHMLYGVFLWAGFWVAFGARGAVETTVPDTTATAEVHR